MERDLDGACVRAGTAERRGMGKRRSLVEPDEQRQQHGAHRARVDRTVRGTPGLAVHGTDVQAGAATDAGEHLPVLRAEEVRASVVDDDDVQLFGAVLLAGPARAGQQCGVDAEALARAAAREQP